MTGLSIEDRRQAIEKALEGKNSVIFLHNYQHGKVATIINKDPAEAEFIGSYIELLLPNMLRDKNKYNKMKMIYEDQGAGYFEGNRLFDDVQSLNDGWIGIFTLSCENPAVHNKNSMIYDQTPWIIKSELCRTQEDGSLRIDNDYDRRVGHAIVVSILVNLEEIGFTILDERKILDSIAFPDVELAYSDVFKPDSILLTDKESIIQMPTGEFVTHAKCNKCGNNAGCRKFSQIEDAIAYRDADAMCCSCYFELRDAEHDCECCVSRYCCSGEYCAKNKNKDCPDYEFDEDSLLTDDDDEGVCECPLV